MNLLFRYFIILFLSSNAFSQNIWDFSQNKNKIIIPFELLNNSIIIQPKVNNIQLNLISLHLLNKLGNNNLSVMDIKSVNEILEIKNLNNEIIKQIERLGDQISKDFIKLNN